MIHRFAAAVAVLMMVVGQVYADIEDWADFPEFRQNTGLPGNGFGVDPSGQIGFGGALQMNVPCAYTPSWGNFAIGGGAAYKADDSFDKTDGFSYYCLGFGPAGHGLSITEHFAENTFSVNSFHMQYQALDEAEDGLALALGVVDVLNNRLGEDLEPHGGRSLYVVGTRQVAHGENPLYVSLGFGSDRFNWRPFGGVSWYPTGWLNVGAEYDGFVFRPTAAARVWHRSRWELTASGAYSDFERPAFALTLTHRR